MNNHEYINTTERSFRSRLLNALDKNLPFLIIFLMALVMFGGLWYEILTYPVYQGYGYAYEIQDLSLESWIILGSFGIVAIFFLGIAIFLKIKADMDKK